MDLCYISCQIHTVHEELLITSIFLSLQVSERAGHIIQYDKFYIHELDDLIEIRNDYIAWIQKQMYPSVSLPLTSVPRFTLLHLFMWCLYEPFVCASVSSGS